VALDFDECDRARVARDRRYDGRFFTGVRTTGVYCRPICPVRPALSKNVSFFPSAAAAEAAGFRPCLRCRPETAPFCPAWVGTRATVDRATRLIIEEGALDDEGASVESLAERQGIGSRQLSRLFARHLDAAPLQVVKTARVQRAKRLLDVTDLSMAEVALGSGFRSLRRFNAVFVETYQRTPSDVRRFARMNGRGPRKGTCEEPGSTPRLAPVTASGPGMVYPTPPTNRSDALSGHAGAADEQRRPER
jgi:AraC family transcriptional regulator, regulatory protein of adaptative response / methylated-DNA-[protein]-cysteine methyltransferase